MSSPPKKVTFRSTGELPLTAMSLTGTEANRRSTRTSRRPAAIAATSAATSWR